MTNTISFYIITLIFKLFETQSEMVTRMITKIIGTGSCVPERIVTNDDLAQIVETSDEWIQSRTGIRERRISEGADTAELAAGAAKAALENAGISADDVDLILVATSTPDHCFPNAACMVQAAIGAERAVAYDISAACSGFLFAVNTAHAFLGSGIYRTALVIGADTLSKIVDWSDRSTCVLFGDGAGAVFVRADNTKRYVAVTGSDGQKGDVLQAGRIPLKNLLVKNDFTDTDYYMSMNGQEVFKFAVKTVPEAIRQVTEKAGVALDEIDCFLLHQANVRIIASVAKRLGIPEDKVPVNLNHYGNTSAASIAILLDEVRRERRFSPGSRLVLAGFGGGLTWGASYIEL